MRDSQQEIKSTVTVNTSDMAAKAHEDKESGKELDKMNKKKGKLVYLYCFINLLTAEYSLPNIPLGWFLADSAVLAINLKKPNIIFP